jgi:hypothetical protein
MAQIIRSTNDIIVNALYLIGELGTAETPDAFMLTTGLDLINELLDKWNSDSIYIPYLTTIPFNFVVGKGTYSVSDITTADITADRIIDLTFANYNVPTTGPTQLIYPLRIISKAEFYEVTRQSNLTTRPQMIFLNKQSTESLLTVYPVPDQPYLCTVQMKLMLNSLVQQDTIGELPPNAYGLLKYAVARKFCGYYPSANWTPEMENEYQEYMQIWKNTNETDLSIRPSSIMSNPDPFYWQNIFVFS